MVTSLSSSSSAASSPSSVAPLTSGASCAASTPNSSLRPSSRTSYDFVVLSTVAMRHLLRVPLASIYHALSPATYTAAMTSAFSPTRSSALPTGASVRDRGGGGGGGGAAAPTALPSSESYPEMRPALLPADPVSCTAPELPLRSISDSAKTSSAISSNIESVTFSRILVTLALISSLSRACRTASDSLAFTGTAASSSSSLPPHRPPLRPAIAAAAAAAAACSAFSLSLNIASSAAAFCLDLSISAVSQAGRFFLASPPVAPPPGSENDRGAPDTTAPYGEPYVGCCCAGVCICARGAGDWTEACGCAEAGAAPACCAAYHCCHAVYCTQYSDCCSGVIASYCSVVICCCCCP